MSGAGSPSRPAGGNGSNDSARTGLLLDLYELTMGESYVAEDRSEEPATFSLFCRHLPPGWGYFLAAGLEDVLSDLERLAFSEDDLVYLEETRLFTPRFLDRLRRLRFTGDVRALPEGTVFFPGEPVIEVTGPMLEAQLVESAVLNRIHFQSLVASKAARSVDVARGRRLVDFGLRRTPGPEAGLKVARSSWIAGFDATSNVLAGREYGIPTAGTMAHSYVQSFEDELDALRAFARSYPDAILLVDTYDTPEGVRRAIEAGGARLRGVRLDSGDLLELSREARMLLDEAGLRSATVFASGGIDEYEIERLLAAGAPIDGFGVGTKMAMSADAPYLDMAYKLVAFAGRPTLKVSEGKATIPGAKQVWRVDAGGLFVHDLVELVAYPQEGEPLLRDVMTRGRRLSPPEQLPAIRERAAAQRGALPARCRALEADAYEVQIGPALEALEHMLRDRAVAASRPVGGRLAGIVPASVLRRSPNRRVSRCAR